MEERYDIENLEQLRAIADMLRLRIIERLDKRPMTVTQLGEELDMAPARVHYHVRELERVGLLKLVETREKGGILEKYYQPIAREIGVGKALLSAPRDEAQAMLRALLNQLSDGYLQAFRHYADQHDPVLYGDMSIDVSSLFLTREEQRQLQNQFTELLKPYMEKRGIEGEREVMISAFTYPVFATGEQQVKARPVQTHWVVGAASYSRKDLLKARETATKLHISVIGVCNFARDVDAALIDETIASFKLIGKLTASSEVRTALEYKEAQE